MDSPDLVAEFQIAFCVTLSKVPSQFKRFEHNHLDAEFSGIILYMKNRLLTKSLDMLSTLFVFQISVLQDVVICVTIV